MADAAGAAAADGAADGAASGAGATPGAVDPPLAARVEPAFAGSADALM